MLSSRLLRHPRSPLPGARAASVRCLLAVVVIAATSALSGCFRGAKIDVTADWLREHEVYASAAFAREPYLLTVDATQCEIVCRTYGPERPRILVAPLEATIRQRWESAPVALDALERERLALGGRGSVATVHQHRLRLTGLSPRRSYRVRLEARVSVAGGAAETREVAIETPPSTAMLVDRLTDRVSPVVTGEAARPDAPEARPVTTGRVSFLVLGDSGTGSDEQLAVARAIAAGLERPGSPSYGIDFAVHTGDLVYERGEAHEYDATVFMPYRQLLARAPLYGVLGNHDVRAAAGRAFLEAFPHVDPARPYWSRTIGPVELIGLDSTTDGEYASEGGPKPNEDDLREQASPQRRWLRAALQQPRAPWRIVVLHHPMLSAGVRHGAARLTGARETRALRAALGEAFGAVDFLVQGHDHHYERSVPIARSWVDADGDLTIPDEGRGAGRALGGAVGAEQVRLGDRTVGVVQGTGGGRLADTDAMRLAHAAVWTLTLPLGSPLWLSYQPIGFDWVDRGRPWVERAGICYGFSRFDVDATSARLRTWSVDPARGTLELVDDVTYVR